MARIVIDARESGTTTGRYIDKLTEYLHRLQPKHEIIIITKHPRLDFFNKTAPDFQTVESNYKEFSFAEQLGLLRQLRRLKADLVHFNAPQQPVLYRGKTVTTIHDLTTTRFNNPSKNWLVFKFRQLVYRRVVKTVAKKSKLVIAPSKFVKNDLEQFAHIPGPKIVVTYEAADVIKNKPEPTPSLDGKNFIMYTGRPLPHKNLRRLIDAFAILQTERPELRLVLVGKTDRLYEAHQKYVNKRGIKNVLFSGFVSEGRLRWLYENTSAYVFPSLSEGFGLPGLEAMAHGAPVVSSNATCLPEIYGDAAAYFDPLVIADMATRIKQVLDDENLRKALVQKGFVRVKKYSWAKMAEQTLGVYNQALKS